jgi:hypothetical protein
MDARPIRRISAQAPIYMSVVALWAATNGLRHASHEDGQWHIWMLMLFLQLPFILYLIISSRRQWRSVRFILISQAALWGLSLFAGSFVSGWD